MTAGMGSTERVESLDVVFPSGNPMTDHIDGRQDAVSDTILAIGYRTCCTAARCGNLG